MSLSLWLLALSYIWTDHFICCFNCLICYYYSFFLIEVLGRRWRRCHRVVNYWLNCNQVRSGPTHFFVEFLISFWSLTAFNSSIIDFCISEYFFEKLAIFIGILGNFLSEEVEQSWHLRILGYHNSIELYSLNFIDFPLNHFTHWHQYRTEVWFLGSFSIV